MTDKERITELEVKLAAEAVARTILLDRWGLENATLANLITAKDGALKEAESYLARGDASTAWGVLIHATGKDRIGESEIHPYIELAKECIPCCPDCRHERGSRGECLAEK